MSDRPEYTGADIVAGPYKSLKVASARAAKLSQKGEKHGVAKFFMNPPYAVVKLRGSDLIAPLEKSKQDLTEALQRLVKMYVRNPDSAGEFIACITPPHASALDRRQRRLQETWAAWDNARAVLKSTESK